MGALVLPKSYLGEDYGYKLSWAAPAWCPLALSAASADVTLLINTSQGDSPRPQTKSCAYGVKWWEGWRLHFPASFHGKGA